MRATDHIYQPTYQPLAQRNIAALASRRAIRADRASGMKCREIAQKRGLPLRTVFRAVDLEAADVEREAYWRGFAAYLNEMLP